MKFFIDECLSPRLAKVLNASGYDAFHPRDVSRLGERDDQVLKQCPEEDRTIVTNNAQDFRRLVGRVEIHPGLVILPSTSAEQSEALLRRAIDLAEEKDDPRKFMVNRVIEVAADGKSKIFELLKIQ